MENKKVVVNSEDFSELANLMLNLRGIGEALTGVQVAQENNVYEDRAYEEGFRYLISELEVVVDSLHEWVSSNRYKLQ
ncbi:MAG: hypothetical protein WBI17_13580 [Clostridiaceae bacterium]